VYIFTYLLHVFGIVNQPCAPVYTALLCTSVRLSLCSRDKTYSSNSGRIMYLLSDGFTRYLLRVVRYQQLLNPLQISTSVTFQTFQIHNG